MSDQVTIYALVDPDGAARYIGQTTWPLSRRLASHLVDKEGRARAAWIQELQARGLKPSIMMLEVTGADEANAAERRQIAAHLARGCALTNGARAPVQRKQQKLEDVEPVRVSVRMPVTLHDAVMHMSKEEQRSLNAQIVWCVQHCVGRWQRAQRP